MKRKLKIFFCSLLILVSCFYTYKILNIIKLDLTNEEFISIVMNNPNVFNGSSKTKVASKIFEQIYNVDISNPLTFISSSFKNVKHNNQNNSGVIVSSPVVYIYNTHQQEQYNSENLQDYNINLTVLTASYILKECLEEKSIYAVVEESNIAKLLKDKNFTYDKSYQLTRELLLENKKEYASIKYYIDIHRDSVSKDISTVKIGDKSYARPMFVIGMNNKNYKGNLSLMEKLNKEFDNFNQGLSRGIYKRNATYNQDLNSNVMLIEIGGIDNNLEEVYNTTDTFCKILAKYIGEDNE